MPSLFLTNFYSVPQQDQYPWTYNGTNTFQTVSVVFYINAIINNITKVNGSSSGYAIQYTGNQTIITMDPYDLPDVSTGNAPPMGYTIEYSATSAVVQTSMYVKFIFDYNPSLVTSGCNDQYVFTGPSVPVEF